MLLCRGHPAKLGRIIQRSLTTTKSRNESTTTSSESSQTAPPPPPPDAFTEEFLRNQIKVTELQRVILGVGSSLAALVNPRRHDMIACLGETTGVPALDAIRRQMLASDEGRQILADRPRINTRTVDMAALKALPETSFGHQYVHFLEKHDITPDSRAEVRFMDDPELAYVMTRYREVHDLVHTVLGMPTNMLGEVAVKWVEALNTGLPMCYGGAVFGAFRLRPKQRQNYLRHYLPWALRMGRQVHPLMNVYWEKRWEQDMAELRQELNIEQLVIN